MKKLLLSFVLILAVTITASAQHHVVKRTYKTQNTYTTPAPSPRPRPSYPYTGVGELRLHVVGELGFLDLGGFFMHRFPRHYSAGAMAEYQAGRIFSLGLGAEFYGSHLDYSPYINDYLNCVPIYGMVRLSTPNRHSRLFVEGKVGYAIPVNQAYMGNPGGMVAAQGFYTSAGVGLSFFGSNLSVGFNSIDKRSVVSTQPMLLSGSTSAGMFTDFYLRYSYAIPLN